MRNEKYFGCRYDYRSVFDLEYWVGNLIFTLFFRTKQGENKVKFPSFTTLS